MKNRLFAIAIAMVMTLSASALSSCGNSSDTPCETSASVETTSVVEESKYYKIWRCDFEYYYYIYDKNHNIKKYEGPLNRPPHIIMVNDNLLRFTLQSGTGLGTQWGYYYDAKKDMFSGDFTCIYDQSNGIVAYGANNKIIIRDIFDKEKYYQEITSSNLSQPFSEVAEPIVNAEFTDYGNSIEITYLTGSNYKEVTETIELSDIDS